MKEDSGVSIQIAVVSILLTLGLFTCSVVDTQ